MATKPKVVVTARKTMANADGAVEAETPNGFQDVLLVPLTISTRLLVRTLKVYVSVLLGLLGYSAVSTIPGVPLVEFSASFTTAAQMAVAPAIVNLLGNLVILLTELDESMPTTMG